MLPDDWRKQVEDAAREANHAANEQNRHLYENLSAELNTVTDQLRRYNDTDDRERPKKRRREKWTIVALFAAAIGTGALAVFTAWQAYETHEAFGPIKQSADAAQKSAEAAERESFAGRAYLFPRYVFNLEGIQQQPANNMTRVPITYCIDNLGPTPASIINITGHLFLPEPHEFLNERADITSPELASRAEDYVTATDLPDFGFSDFRDMIADIKVPPNAKFCTFKTTFVYLNDRGKNAPRVHGSIFYLLVTYKDIFGVVDRHTWYEVVLGGTGSSPGNPKYNHWD